jgi:hypothetical protein
MESAGCRYSVVIPCYRSGRSLPELVNRLDLVLRQEAPELDYEILLVHDASPDETWGSSGSWPKSFLECAASTCCITSGSIERRCVAWRKHEAGC